MVKFTAPSSRRPSLMPPMPHFVCFTVRITTLTLHSSTQALVERVRLVVSHCRRREILANTYFTLSHLVICTNADAQRDHIMLAIDDM